MDRKVRIYEREYEVSVYQKSKSVWEAVGTLTEVLAVPDGSPREIRVKGKSESAALGLWIQTAKYWAS